MAEVELFPRIDVGCVARALVEICCAAFARTAGRLVLKNVQQGAATTCYVALHPQVKGVSGKYFSDSNLAEPNSKAKDMDLAKKLWDFSVGLIS
ncbi:hypothetical protein ZIOFF_071377 [Zingiber officinale]|uniref:Uncharacterized protein n=1 Tax=Zingiber officinale TaxID=94328 RepID=A0A8J5EBE3_ZINOF|nr:hypothetical protein ZIOFF_071377 [Zingiber officinale]